MLTGAANFRAVKPFAAADGRQLKPGILYRSGELSRLNETDRARLGALGLRLVCDLRSAPEQAEYVSRWPDGSLHRHLDLPDREAGSVNPAKIFSMIMERPGQEGALAAMALLYRRKPAAYAGALRKLFSAILAGDALPLLIHCHAGKDRTGFIIAMLLAAAGISRPDIFEDYETTAQFFAPEAEAEKMREWARRGFKQELDAHTMLPLAQARPDYLAAAFDEIDTTYGGTEGYFAGAVGLSGDELAAYRDQVLR